MTVTFDLPAFSNPFSPGAGTDMSESASLSDERIATRLLTDLAVVTLPR